MRYCEKCGVSFFAHNDDGSCPLEKQEIIPFPECSVDCKYIEYFGVCECESICPEKFDKDGNPIRKEEP